MASPRTYYLLSTAGTGGGPHMDMQDGTDGSPPPGNATSGTGWIVDTEGSPQYALMYALEERASTVFDAPALPAVGPHTVEGDCFRTPAKLTGRFSAGNWVLDVPVIAVTLGGHQDGRINTRWWRSTNADASSPTEITVGGRKTGSTVTDLTTATQQVSSVTHDPGVVDLSDEYLFFQLAWEITGAGELTEDVLIRIGSAAKVVTADWNPAIEPTGIASAEAFESPTIDHAITDVGGIAGGEAFGTLTIDQTLEGVGGIASGEAFETPDVGLTIIDAGGIATGEALGAPTIDNAITDAGAIASAEAFGTPTLDITIVDAGGIVSSEAFGSATLDLVIFGAGGIASEESLKDGPFIVLPIEVEENGGYEVEIILPGLADGNYNVYVGPAGNNTDPACWSGISGSPNVIAAKSGVLKPYTPALPLGGPYDFTIIPVGGGATTQTGPLLVVVRRWFRSIVHAVRRRWAPWVHNGPRHPRNEPTPTQAPREEVLEAFLSALGDALTDLSGHRITRLTALLRTSYRIATGINDATSADGITVNFGTAVTGLVAGQRFRALSGAANGSSALISVVVNPQQITLVGAGVGVAFTNASWEAIVDAATTALVESTLGWESSGELAIDGVRYRFTGRSTTSFTGLEHWDGDSWVSGAKQDHLALTDVHDATRKSSALDRLRRGTQVGHAEGADLNVHGSNLALPRPSLLADDEKYRAFLRAIAYRSRGHRNALWKALNALVGVGAWEWFEDRKGHVRNVYIRIAASQQTSLGKWYLNETERRPTTAATTVALTKSPTNGVVSAILAPEGGPRLIAEGIMISADGLTVTGGAGTFPARILPQDEIHAIGGDSRSGRVAVIATRVNDTQITLESPGLSAVAPFFRGEFRILRRVSLFETIRPSSEQILDYDGDAGTSPWTYVGVNEAGTVAIIANTAIEFTSAADLAYYRHRLRATADSDIRLELQLSPEALPGATGRQFVLRIADGEREIAVGMDDAGGGNASYGFVDTLGAFLGGGPAGTIPFGAYSALRIEKRGRAPVELYLNNTRVQTLAHGSFSALVANPPEASFGAFDVVTVGARVRVRRADWGAETPTDFALWRASDGVLNGTILESASASFVAADQGRMVRVVNVPGAGGVLSGLGLGEWRVESLLGPTQVKLTGLRRPGGRLRDPATGRFECDDPGAFRYPDSIGHFLVFHTGPNAGQIRVIGTVLEPGTFTDLATLPSSPDDGLSSVCRLSGITPLIEDDLPAEWEIRPNFAGQAGVSFEIAGRSTLAGATVTLPQAVPIVAGGFNPVLEVIFSMVRSGHLTRASDRNFAAGAGRTQYPAYLPNSGGWLRELLNEVIMAAGYGAVFDQLFRNSAGLHIQEPP